MLATLTLPRDRQGQAPSAMLRCLPIAFSEGARETPEPERSPPPGGPA